MGKSGWHLCWCWGNKKTHSVCWQMNLKYEGNVLLFIFSFLFHITFFVFTYILVRNGYGWLGVLFCLFLSLLVCLFFFSPFPFSPFPFSLFPFPFSLFPFPFSLFPFPSSLFPFPFFLLIIFSLVTSGFGPGLSITWLDWDLGNSLG